MLTRHRNARLRQTLWRGRLPEGLEVAVLSMPGFRATAAALVVRFGSVDQEYARADGSRVSTPAGVAHFLEHELFKKEGRDALLEFSRLGASANAYTDYTSTVYYFRTTEAFDECFRLLLEFTQKPFFDDAYVEKERKIIEQELRMYDDSPDFIAYRNLMQALYREHPVRVDIGGSVESIQGVQRSHLEDLYGGFYRLSNALLVVAGDAEGPAVAGRTREILRAVGLRDGPEARRSLPEESAGPARPHVEASMASARPRVVVGFKDLRRSAGGEEILRDRIVTGIGLELLFGRTSDFYVRAYKEGLIDPSFSMAYRRDANFGFSVIGGETDRPEELTERVFAEAGRWGRRPVPRRALQRAKRKRLGRIIGAFDAPSEALWTVAECLQIGVDPFGLLDAVRRVRPAEVAARIREGLRRDNAAVSVVRPLPGGAGPTAG